jgi:uncharacterized lipoprotein YddW (UPF0748 family)
MLLRILPAILASALLSLAVALPVLAVDMPSSAIVPPVAAKALLSQSHFKVSVLNPTPQNNPMASGFPGYRASHQLVAYAKTNPSDTQALRTGTNEFGFEVTVVNNTVVAQEGSDSLIPPCEACFADQPPTSFILSGHGKAREWLISNAPIGAHITLAQSPGPLVPEPSSSQTPAPQSLSSVSQIEAKTYCLQLQQKLDANRSTLPPATVAQADQSLLQINVALAKLPPDPLIRAPLEEPLAKQAQNTLELVNQALWKQGAPAFPLQATKAAWHRPVEQSETAIGETLDRLKKAGLNTVFLETFFHGYTIFPSQTYAQYGIDKQNPKFANFKGWPIGSTSATPKSAIATADPLASWVRQAHRRGMKLHVWFETFYGGTSVFKSPGPILSKHPDWANVQYSALSSAPDTQQPIVKASTLEQGQFFLDPTNPEVRQFLQSLLSEIATRYAVDGIQLDYIRYPAAFAPDRFSYLATTWGYTPEARAQFSTQTGSDPVALVQQMATLPRQAMLGVPATSPTPSPLSPTISDTNNPSNEGGDATAVVVVPSDADNTRALWEQWKAFKVNAITSFVEQASQQIRSVVRPASFPPVLVSAAVFPKLEDSLAKKHQDWATWAQAGWVDFLAPMSLTSAPKAVAEDTGRMTTLVAQSGHPVPIITGVFGPFNQSPAETILDQLSAAKHSGAAGFSLFDTAHLSPRIMDALQSRLLIPGTVQGPVLVEQLGPHCPQVLGPRNNLLRH